jgi:hypothetical protein
MSNRTTPRLAACATARCSRTCPQREARCRMGQAVKREFPPNRRDFAEPSDGLEPSTPPYHHPDPFANREGVVARRLSVFGLGATPQSELDHQRVESVFTAPAPLADRLTSIRFPGGTRLPLQCRGSLGRNGLVGKKRVRLSGCRGGSRRRGRAAPGRRSVRCEEARSSGRLGAVTGRLHARGFATSRGRRRSR